MMRLTEFSSRHQTFISLFILLVINLATGLIAITVTPIGLDEPFSIFHAQASVADIIAELQKGNNPPLFELVLHYWIRYFGIGAVAVRIPSMLFSMFSVFGLFYLVRLVAGSWQALMAAAMLSFCNYFIYISHEARAYALFWFLMVLSFNVVLRWVRSEKDSWWPMVLLALVNTLMMYTHYLAVPVVVLQFVAIPFIYRHRLHRIKWMFLAFSLQLLGFIPFLKVFYGRFSESTSSGTWIRPVENLGQLHEVILWFANGQSWLYAVFLSVLYGAVLKWGISVLNRNTLVKWAFQITVLLLYLIGLSIFVSMPFIWHITAWQPSVYLFVAMLAVMLLGVGFHSYGQHPVQTFFVLLFTLPWLSMFAVSFFVPVFIDRYVLFIAPFFFATLLIAVRYLAGKRTLLVLTLLAGGMLVEVSPSFTHHQMMDEVMAMVRQNKDDETSVIINPTYFNLTFAYYYDPEIFKDHENLNERLKSDNIYCIYNADGLPSELKRKVILLDAHGSEFYPDNGIREQLETQFNLLKEERFPLKMWVYVYRRD